MSPKTTAEYKRNTAQAMAEKLMYPELGEGVEVTIIEIMGKKSLSLEMNISSGQECRVNLGASIDMATGNMVKTIDHCRKNMA